MLFKLFFALFLMLSTALPASGSEEYFVGLEGCDETHDGRGRSTAFATVQRGVDALQAGDTLTILPGEYFGTAIRDNLGDPAVKTVIRADIPGSAVLRGDLPAPEFQPLDGFRSVHVAEFDHNEVQVVNERDTMQVFQGRPNIWEVELTPGTFHHDPDSNKLYISTSDGRAPEAHHYTVSVLPGNGLELSAPQHVLVEGLAATGFNIAGHNGGGHGIRLNSASDSVVRDCHVWMNGFGIKVNSSRADSGRNVIERCVSWANDSPFANWRKGGISVHRHRGDTIRDCTAFLNRQGIYLRSDSAPEKTSRLMNNLAWGNRWDCIIKGNPDMSNVTERCVGGAYSTWSERPARNNPVHCLVFTGSGPGADEAPGNIWLERERDVDQKSEFADPCNRDYRLQSTSRFRGAGPEGGDLGPFPYEESIYYVRPDGDDGADGLSVEKAWRTIERAVKALRPGDTLYLGAGSYTTNLELRTAGEEDAPVSIRGRGLEPVVINGNLRIKDSAHLELKRLRFKGEVRVSDSSRVAFEHCEFSGPEVLLEAKRVSGLDVVHSRFSGFSRAAVSLENSGGALLRGNIYQNRDGAVALRTDAWGSVRYSDYNAYRSPGAGWEVDGEMMALEELEEGYEHYSRVLPEEPGTASLPGTARRMNTAGPMGNPLGTYRHEPRTKEQRLSAEPRVHSVSATTADIEWMTLLPARVHLVWGESPEMENSDEFNVRHFGSYSLTGLEPGRRYYFQIKSLPVERGRRPSGSVIKEPEMESEVISFTTAEQNPEPAVYYIASDGHDANSGLSREDAWRTVQHAAGQVGVGDTVLLAGGTYEEQVRVRATGAEGAPITFRSMPGEKVVFKGPQLSDAFYVAGKSHLHFDGMYFLSMRFNLYRAENIKITRVFAGRYDSGYPPEGVLLHGQDSKDLLVKNSVALSGKSGPRLRNCSNVRFENCVFFRNMIRQVLFYPHPSDGSVALVNNIFTDGLTSKRGTSMVQLLGSPDLLEERNNCYFPRHPKEEKNVIMFSWNEEMTFDEMREKLGETGSVLANPEFLGAADIPGETDDGRAIYPVDRINRTGVIPMNEFFATNSEVVESGIGLQQEAFEDFHFNQ